MGSRLRFTEDEFELTSGAAIDILQFDEHEQDAIFYMICMMKSPGEGLYDSYAISIDDDLILEVKILGSSDRSFTVYSLNDIHLVDDYLDYINNKKALKWNTSTMTLIES